MADEQLTIGELASRTGVATSALRYWEQLGLLPAPVRVSGQRRYPSSSVGLVGEILILRDIGFSLREIGPDSEFVAVSEDTLVNDNEDEGRMLYLRRD